MREYRAYLIGIDGHRFVRIRDFSAEHADDAVALEAARALKSCYSY